MSLKDMLKTQSEAQQKLEKKFQNTEKKSVSYGGLEIKYISLKEQEIPEIIRDRPHDSFGFCAVDEKYSGLTQEEKLKKAFEDETYYIFVSENVYPCKEYEQAGVIYQYYLMKSGYLAIMGLKESFNFINNLGTEMLKNYTNWWAEDLMKIKENGLTWEQKSLLLKVLPEESISILKDKKYL